MESIRHNVLVDLCLLFMMLLVGSADSDGQDTLSFSGKDHLWFDGGLGVCSGSTPLSLGAILSYQTGTKLISIRYVYNTEFQFLGPDPDETIQDIGALYGFIREKTTKSLASISGGLSYVRVVRRGKLIEHVFFGDEYEKLIYQTVGVALHGQVFWTPLSFFGMGLDVPASLNKERSFIAVQFSLQVRVPR